jgi:penicillin-binding protein activator
MRTRVERFSAALILAALTVGCGGPQPTYVRGSEVRGLDEPAMGLGLDMRDLEQLMGENMASMTSSYWFQTTGVAPPATVAVLPMRNETSEHIDGQLEALLGMVETELVHSGRFTVVSHALREDIIDEMRLQQGAEFDPSLAVQIGRQLGVRYFITGRVYDSAERAVDMRRVQYFMFMQVIDVETGAIVWQNQSNLTKGIVPMET